ncbi:MBL fold metallo-hydrolase [Streptomyces sp. NPDC094034]|uniref:MBL fold metallo-hydrolase n=1 Tax=Streptomyces sp. NPDC094034 TaxID=3155309 RepID=UPI003325B672
MVSTFSVEDLTVHRIVELVAPFLPALEMLPSLTPSLLDENRAWLEPHSINESDTFILSYQSYVVRTPHHNIVVDSGLGNDKERPRPEWHMRSGGQFLRGLADVDLGVEDIDFVLCTHLHGDHVGWNTRLVDGRWIPTFPNARYIFSNAEVTAAEAIHQDGGFPAYLDSVRPLFEAGRADLVGDDFHIGDHTRLLPTPGHTAGHTAFSFGKDHDAVVMSGDLLHVPLQMRYPEQSFVRDRDPDLAATTRRNFLERYCDTETLCCTGHFPSPSVGRVRRWADGFRLVSSC